MKTMYREETSFGTKSAKNQINSELKVSLSQSVCEVMSCGGVVVENVGRRLEWNKLVTFLVDAAVGWKRDDDGSLMEKSG